MSRSSRNSSILREPLFLGCLVTMVLPFLLYLLHGTFILTESLVSEAKWEQKGSNNYVISAMLIAMPTIWGEVEVNNGKVVKARSGDYGQLGRLDSYYGALTVKRLFEKVRSYAFAPFCLETVSYDIESGFPIDAAFNCFLFPGVEGEMGMRVESVRLIQ